MKFNAKTRGYEYHWCKWVFKVKYKDNTLDKLKARLVAKGYNHAEGVDYS